MFGKLYRVSMASAAMAIAASMTPAIARPLIIGETGPDVVTMDPQRATTTLDKGVTSQMFNGLARFAPGRADIDSIEPDLAESWDHSEDAKTWTFKLREGVPFHGDYGELTAEDVVYSLERARDPERSAFAASFSNIDTITEIDSHTVQVTLKEPDLRFIGLVTDYHAGNIVSKKAAEEKGSDFGSHPIGTGPFSFSSQKTQQEVVLDAHDDYFRGKPAIEQVIFRMIPSDSSRELAATSGEIDLFYAKREQRWVETARKRGDLTVDVFRPGEMRTLHLNASMAPLDDVRVRQAIAHAINRDEIVAFVGDEVAKPACSVVPPGYLGENCDNSDMYDHDPDRARALLAEAGFEDGLTIKSVVSNITAQLPIMEVVQAQLGEVGITLDMEVVDHATYQSKSRADQSGIIFYGAARFPVADSYLTEFYHSDAIVGKPTAITNFSHCDVADAEIDAARYEADEDEQMRLWAEAQRKIHENVCSIPMFELLQVWARTDKLDFGYDLEGSLNLAPPITEATTLAD